MRIRIVHQPPVAGIDGIRLDCFQVGHEYDVGSHLGALLLAEGWAEPVDGRPGTITPFTPGDPFDSRVLYEDMPRNLVKERDSPFVERTLAAHANRRRKTDRMP
jgi:hypothetical protein